MIFCRWALQQIENDDQFLFHVFFTDESFYSNEPTFNQHNNHYWAPSGENPNVQVVVRNQRRFSLNVWAGIIGNTLVIFNYE